MSVIHMNNEYYEGEVCIFCKKGTNEPLRLLCTHTLCMKCALQNKILVNNQFNQPKYHIICKLCKKTTQTYDLDNLRTMVNELIITQESDQQLTTLSTPRKEQLALAQNINNIQIIDHSQQTNNRSQIIQSTHQQQQQQQSITNSSNTFKSPDQSHNSSSVNKSATITQKFFPGSSQSQQKPAHRKHPSFSNIISKDVKQIPFNQSIDDFQPKSNPENQKMQSNRPNTSKIAVVRSSQHKDSISKQFFNQVTNSSKPINQNNSDIHRSSQQQYSQSQSQSQSQLIEKQKKQDKIYETYQFKKKEQVTPQTFKEASQQQQQQQRVHQSNNDEEYTFTCSNHGQELQYFCKGCGELICEQCINTDEQQLGHKQHEIGQLNECNTRYTFKERQRILQEQIDIIQQCKQRLVYQREKQFEKVYNEINELMEVLKQRQNNIIKKISLGFEKLFLKLDRQLGVLCSISDSIIELNETTQYDNSIESQIYYLYAGNLLKTHLSNNSSSINSNSEQFKNIKDNIELIDIKQKQQIKRILEQYPKITYKDFGVIVNSANEEDYVFNQSFLNESGYVSETRSIRRLSSSNEAKPLFIENNMSTSQQQSNNNINSKHRRIKSAVSRDNLNINSELFFNIKDRNSDSKQSNNNSSNNKLMQQQQQESHSFNVSVQTPSITEREILTSKNIKIIHFEQNILNNELFSYSNILTGQYRTKDIMKLIPDNLKKTQLLYSMQSHGTSSNIFHQHCDNKGPYVVLIKTSGDHSIFGYFMPVSFVSEERYTKCEKAWIFSYVTNKKINPMKFPIKNDKQFIALYQSEKSPCLGSTLQSRQDLYVDLDSPDKSTYKIGYAYQLPEGLDGNTVLTGNNIKWKIIDVEVYQVYIMNNSTNQKY